MTYRGPESVRRRTDSRYRVLFAVALALLMIGSGLALTIHSAAPVSPGPIGPSSPIETSRAPTYSGASREPTEAATPAAIPVTTAGSVIRTDFLNYNATLPGNFPSTVAGWQVGTPAYVPATHMLWIPERPMSVGGIPAPPTAPAVLFDTITSDFIGFLPWLTNTAALAFDASNDVVYSADYSNDTVGVLNATTGLWAHRAIPVGSNPVALVLNSTASRLYVANEGSNNVTIIDCNSNSVWVTSISIGASPVGLAIDGADHSLLVADGSDADLWKVNLTTNASEAYAAFTGDLGGVAYSSTSRFAAVTVPSSGHLSILDVSSILPVVEYQPFVGSGGGPVQCNLNGSDFVVGNQTGSDIVVVNSSSGAIVDPSLTVGNNVTTIALNGINGVLFAWASDSRTLVEVNLATEAVSGRSPSLGPEPSGVAFVPTTERAFVPDVFGGSVLVLNATTGLTAAPPISLSSGVLSVAAEPSGGSLYVGAWDEVASFNPRTDQVVAQNTTLTSGNTALLVDPTDGLLWVANGAEGLVAVSLFTLDTTFKVGIPTGFISQNTMTLDATAHELFVVNTTARDLEVVDSTNGTILSSSISAGANLTSVAYDSADNEVYALGANVTIIDASTFDVIGSPIPIALHALATGIAYDPSREAIYATTATGFPVHGGTISVLDGSSVSASRGSFVSIAVGQLPTAPVAIQLAGSLPPAFGEVWVPNEQSGTVSVIASPPVITYLAASPAVVDVNQTSQILLSYEGGTGPTEITYTGLPTGCVSQDLTTLNCTASETGSFRIIATVEDALGVTADASTTLTVVAELTLLASTTPGPNPTLDVGSLLTGSATALGGSPPYVYSWTLGDGSSASTPDITYRYVSPGIFFVNISVSDARGALVRQSFVVTVEPLPTAEVTVSPSNTTDVGVTLQFSSTVAGGTGSGTAGWSFGDGSTATGLLASHAWNRSGSFSVLFHDEDSLGNYANQTLSVQVNPALAATFSSGSSGSRSSLSVGSPIVFTAQISGGTPPYTVVWSFGDGSFGKGLTTSHAYATAGSYAVNVTATDAADAMVNASLPVVVAATTPSSGGLGGSFDLGVFFGVVAGGGLAAVVLYVAGSSRRRRPPPPQAPWVPPAGSTPIVWRED
jgi:YVTN family beta-propeller protein